MSRNFLTPINLNKNELQNAAIQNLASAPANPVVGQIYFDTVIGNLRQFNGTIWLDYVTSESGNEFISSVDTTNFTVDTGYLSLNSEIQVQKTSYWRNGTQQGIVAAQSDDSLRLTAITGQLQLESNAGDVRVNPASTVTWFNNNLQINGDGGIITTDVNSLHLTADNGTVTTDTSEFHTPKVEFWNGGDTAGTRLGVAVAHPYDGSFTLAASNQLVLEAHSGDIGLYPDGSTVNYANFSTTAGFNITSGNNIYSKGVYVGGVDNGTNGVIRVQDLNGNNVFTVDADSEYGSAVVETHGNQNLYTSIADGGTQYGSFNYDASKNFLVTASYNDLILGSDSNKVYITSNSSDGNLIATRAYVDSVAQGLSVLGSVAQATSENIDLTLALDPSNSGGLDLGILSDGDRILVKSQTDYLNGIYIYSSTTGLLTASTSAADVDLKTGSYTFVEKGTYAAQGWIIVDNDPSNSNPEYGIWVQFSAAGEYVAGNGIDISSNTISVKIDGTSLNETGSGLYVQLSEGGGLSTDAYGLYVMTGTGLIHNNMGQIALDTDEGFGVRKYAVNNGALTATSGSVTWAVSHNLGTQDVTVQLRELDGNSLVEVDVVLTDSNTVTLSWVSGNVSADSYRVVVVG